MTPYQGSHWLGIIAAPYSIPPKNVCCRDSDVQVNDCIPAQDHWLIAHRDEFSGSPNLVRSASSQV